MPNHDTDQGAPLDPEIWAKVQDAFAGALGLELDEIEPQHRIIDDLATAVRESGNATA